MTQPWWKNSVIYQIYPRSFMDSNGDGIGDLKGITSKLDYLQLLGVEVLWISPIFASPNADNGYDVSNYQDIMTEFGTMNDFDELLEKAHQKGLKIMLDLVVNHSSDEHAWFIESRKSKDNPYRDYYIWKKGKNGQSPNNWGAAWGDSAWKYDETSDEFYLHLFHEKQPDLNWENPTLRKEIYQMMNFWLGKGVDGFRMDVINFISKVPSLPDGEKQPFEKYGNSGAYFLNGPKIHEFLQEMNQESLSHFDTVTVGEMPGVNVEQAKLYTGENRHELNMVFHFEHVDLGNGQYGKWNPKPWKLSELKKIFDRWQTGLEQEGWNSLYWSNHDQPRALSRWVPSYFNLPIEDEYTRKKAAKMLATCLHFMKGTPYIYQGEEIGMTNVAFSSMDDYRDVETLNAYRDLVGEGKLSHEEMMKGIYERSRDNARTPMQWNKEIHAGFTTGIPWIKANPNYLTINVEEALADSDSIFYYYQKLIRLRKENEVMVHGNFTLLESGFEQDDETVFAYIREYQKKKLLVLCNFSNHEQMIPKIHEEWKKATIFIQNYDTIETIPYALQPFEARVYFLD